MSPRPMRLVFLGLSLSSSWGNGHATTYRALLAALAARGHSILFLERDRPWYADNRDLTKPRYCDLQLYRNMTELRQWRREIAAADAVVVGSYVPQGVAVSSFVLDVARGVKAFYDIDTPVTLAQLKAGTCSYLAPELIPEFDLYLSFTSGPALEHIESTYGAPAARALYCSVDPRLYRPRKSRRRGWDLGYIGTYSADRQPTLEALLLETARRSPSRRFVVAGPQYPSSMRWPENVEHIPHVPPRQHALFYSSMDWTLNVTRADMIALGHSPSVRLFEAAACATPIISDAWDGLDELLRPRREIVIARGTDDVLAALDWNDRSRLALGRAGQRRVLSEHTAVHRAKEFERYVREVRAAVPQAVTGADRHRGARPSPADPAGRAESARAPADRAPG